ncbi:protein SIEVE ELEMENT OCCLUSION B [Rosa chinensis]|nr:protein SIEVE ELEMENT OCCLUSION B [Rosa chinensis]
MASRSRKDGSGFLTGTNSTGITDTIRSERIQFTDSLTSEEIEKLINEKHSPEDNTDFAVDVLLTITETIIGRATRDSIVNDILKEANAPSEKFPSINKSFISPLCILKSICCEISSCKDKACSGEEISIQTRTEVIFDKLKPYAWEAKAVLALAAFALEYGDFWHLAQLYGQCNQLTDSVTTLKRVPDVKAPLKKCEGEVLELNRLIKDTLEVTRLICKVEDLYIHNRTEDAPTLYAAVECIPICVFWTITAIVACAAKVIDLTSDEEMPHDLPDVVPKIQRIREKLNKLHGTCVKEIDVAKSCKRLHRKMVDAQRTLKITEVINTLILFTDNGKLPVISVGSNEEVKSETFADLVKENSVLFYISSLENITDVDISDLIQVYDEIQKNNRKWRMVWIPIVEDWTKNQNEKFEKWGSKMPWYKVRFLSSIVIKYLEQEWSYTGITMSMVMDPRGQRQFHNALDLIRRHKNKFFDILDNVSVIESIFGNMKNKKLEEWSKDDTVCIFLYGDMDESRINELKKKVEEAKDTIKDFGMSIELHRVEGNEAKALWSGIGSLLTDYLGQVEYKTVKKELCQLLSYKNHGEWIIVSQGYDLITSGHPATICDVLKNMSQWKQDESKTSRKTSTFGNYFQEDHKTMTQLSDHNYCCEFDISGNPPKNLDCPVCGCSMKTTPIIRYKCCHGATETSH